MFRGAIVALVTPFTDDGKAVDYDKLAELVERQIAAGIHGIVPAGCTGEAATLSHDEQEELIRRTVRLAKNRTKVIAGTGSNSTDEAVRLTCAAADAGADGALVITPYYNKPTPSGQLRHYQAVAEAAAIPIMLYNVPGRTGVKMTPETIARIHREVDNVTCIKESCNSVDQVSDILALSDITVVSGDDSLTLPMLSVGGAGGVSVVANILPQEMVRLIEAWNAGDAATARKIHYKLLPLCRAMFLETNPIPVKTALHMMGLMNGVLRMPLCRMAPGHERNLREALERYDLPLTH